MGFTIQGFRLPKLGPCLRVPLKGALRLPSRRSLRVSLKGSIGFWVLGKGVQALVKGFSLRNYHNKETMLFPIGSYCGNLNRTL